MARVNRTSLCQWNDGKSQFSFRIAKIEFLVLMNGKKMVIAGVCWQWFKLLFIIIVAIFRWLIRADLELFFTVTLMIILSIFIDVFCFSGRKTIRTVYSRVCQAVGKSAKHPVGSWCRCDIRWRTSPVFTARWIPAVSRSAFVPVEISNRKGMILVLF